MRILDGDELAGYVKERQAKQVRGLKQAAHIYPKLAVVHRAGEGPTRTFMDSLHMLTTYAQDIQVEVTMYTDSGIQGNKLLNKLSNDRAVHGVVVRSATLEAPAGKDVSGLLPDSPFDPATPMAILWLLAAYGITMADKDVAVLGNESPVSTALMRVLEASGVSAKVTAAVGDLAVADITLIVAAPEEPVVAGALKQGAVVVDASLSARSIAADVYDRSDGAATPPGKGLSELAVAALLDNLLRAARQAADDQEQA